MVLQFGKYKGQDISQVPLEYVEWLLSKAQQDARIYEAEIERREFAESAQLSWVERLVQVGYRTLAKQHHPDHGGDTKTMQQVNAAYERLKSLVN